MCDTLLNLCFVFFLRHPVDIFMVCIYVCKTLFKETGSVSKLLVSKEGIKQFSYLQKKTIKMSWEGINNLLNRKKKNHKSITKVKCPVKNDFIYNPKDTPC